MINLSLAILTGSILLTGVILLIGIKFKWWK